MARMPATISVRDLRKSYGQVVAVDGVTFAVEQGEFFGILGPNGAGKTTTLEIIEGLREPDGGEVTVLGRRPWPRNPALLPLIGVQLQASSFFELLTAREQLRTFAALYGISAQRADAMLAVVGMADQAGIRTEKLSGGQAQRLSIACALVHDPELLFLDEPTGALDPQARRNLWDLLRKISAEGRTVVLTTHHMDEAEALCHRVAIMDHGKILKIGPPGLIRELDQPLRISVASGRLSVARARALLPGHRHREVAQTTGLADHRHPRARCSPGCAARAPTGLRVSGATWRTCSWSSRAASTAPEPHAPPPWEYTRLAPALSRHKPGSLPGDTVLAQPDVVHRPPVLPGEQELSGTRQRRDTVQHRLRVTPVALHHRLGVDDVSDFTAAWLNADQVALAQQVRPHPPSGPFQVVELGHALAVAADPDQADRLQGARVSRNQLARAVTGQNRALRRTDAPALAAERDRLHQFEGSTRPSAARPAPAR